MDRKWTVIVYMVADTGASFYLSAMDNLTQMTTAEFNEEIKVLVHTDAPSPWVSKSWEVKTGTATPLEQGWDHKCFLDFARKCVREYDAENYLIVLWGHGEGIDWKQKILANSLLDANSIRVGKRLWQGSERTLEVVQIGQTLRELHKELENLGSNLKKDRVVVGFDACLMAMVEVYSEIQPYVSWAVAANDEIPDSGWPYDRILTKLGRDPGRVRPENLANAIVEECVESYSHLNNKSAVSFSACNLSQDLRKGLEEGVEELTKELVEHLKKSPVKASTAIWEARDFAEDLKESAYVDLNAFCSKLQEVACLQANQSDLRELGKAAGTVVEVLKEFAAKKGFSDEYPQKYTKDSRAVSICFPSSPDLEGSVPGIEIDLRSYNELQFVRKTNWCEFWAPYYKALKSSKEQIPLLVQT